MLLNGTHCLLTGATGGIGSALAQQLAAAGVNLLLTARSQDRLDQLRADLPQDTNAETMVADMCCDEDIQALAIRATAMQCNVLINLSGVNTFCLLEDQPPAELQNMMQLNVIAPMRLTQLMLPGLRQRKSATVVNIGSAFGTIGHAGYTSYCTSKFALRGFSEALRRELTDTAINVVYIAPRATATTMNDAAATALNEALGNHVDSPEWVAGEVIKAITHERRSTVLGWPEKFFAWLNQVAPTVVDRAMAKQLPVIKDFAKPSSKFS